VNAPTEGRSNDTEDSVYEELERVLDQFPKYRVKTSLGDLNAKVEREDILKLTIGNESSLEINNDYGVRVANIATLKI
jgi:hypothetical protein